jgi:hypothetical protein
MECKIRSSLPQQTPQITPDVLDVDYSELWARVQAIKYILPDRGELRMAKDEDSEGRSEATTQITDTTSIQPHKTSRRYAEEMLHPRWIAITEDMRGDEMEYLETQLDLRCASDDGAAPLESGLRVIQNTIGDLFAEIASEQSEKIENLLKYLNACGSLEAQWEQRIWRPFFLKDIDGTPMDHSSRAQGHQIQQAKLSFDDRCVLPPLLARQDDRRASRRIVSPKPWDPEIPEFKQSTNVQGGSVSWFPDYLYALGLSHLTDPGKKLNPRVEKLPSVRIAQFECSPSYFMVEIKRDVDQEPAAKQYLAFLGAYTLHERLLLRLAALSSSVNEAAIPMEIDDSLSTYLLTCCKTTCKIWKMQIRRKPRDQRHRQTSSEGQERLEPIRYDLQLLDEIDIAIPRKRQQLADWINLIHYYGSTKHLTALQTDVRAAMLRPANTDWMARIAFVYSNDDGTKIQAVQRSDLSKAYNRGDLEPDEDISSDVVDFEIGREVLYDSGMRSRLRSSKKGPQDGSSTSTLLASASDPCGLSIEMMSSGRYKEGKDVVSLALSKLPSPPDSAASTSPDTRQRNRSPQKKYSSV